MSDDAKMSAFVIQNFDGSKFDKRYLESIRPGIVKGGATPRRADDILGVQPVIQKIEQAINDADICVAEVSLDNPNVWLELGYALALNRPTVILCDRALRPSLPFDVQHRPVVFYSTDSKSGYEELEERIATEVRHLVRRVQTEARQPVLQTGATDAGELRGYEVSILAALLSAWSSSPTGITQWELERKIERAGFTDTQIALGLSRMVGLGYIEQRTESARDGDDYFIYRIAPLGIAWVHQNESEIKPAPTRIATAAFVDDDIPF